MFCIQQLLLITVLMAKTHFLKVTIKESQQMHGAVLD